jgi:hypothetical protein
MMRPKVNGLRLQMVWVLASSLIALMTGACGVMEPEATPTVAVPTVTRTPTATPEPTPVLVPQAGDAIPSPTSSLMNLPPLSPLALAPEDLPTEFVRVDPGDYGFNQEDLTFQQFSVDEVFAYVTPGAGQAVVGLRVDLDTWTEKLGWQLVVASPQILVDVFLPQADVQASPPDPLSGLEGIGESAGGFGLSAQAEGMTTRAEVVVFDREDAGAILISLRPDGQAPIISTPELARRWDRRIQSALRP